MPTKNNQNEIDLAARPHYLHELPFEDEERLGKLFKKLDKDGNGKIDIRDLSEALKGTGVHQHYAEVCLRTKHHKWTLIGLAHSDLRADYREKRGLSRAREPRRPTFRAQQVRLILGDPPVGRRRGLRTG
ncbi:hypothetical protein Zmor_007929 [Zophobas morio]|uniref:EF-hand domain-containing protein n=1 Tax=Zophobas morio TaxID=2755281 RepID=A0AA38MQ26_9CUCU|nr:hypothetical protein Zmor_007929 [Zophobas morio]